MDMNYDLTQNLIPEEHTIMLIDDSLESLNLLTRILSGQGFGVRQARSGSMAIAAINKTAPDLIILDIKMPEMDGFEVCTRLKENPLTRMIPIIFVSALNDWHDKRQAFETGAVDYLTKPFQEPEVLARIRLHLALSLKTRHLKQAVERRTIKLEESNTALKVLVEHRQQEIEKLEENVIYQINALVLPYVNRLNKTRLDDRQRALTQVIESSLSEVTSQFSGKLFTRAAGVTPREMEVATLIKAGKTNIEISDILNISEPAVSFHRQNLRKKLGLIGTKTNLAVYLNEMTLS